MRRDREARPKSGGRNRGPDIGLAVRTSFTRRCGSMAGLKSGATGAASPRYPMSCARRFDPALAARMAGLKSGATEPPAPISDVAPNFQFGEAPSQI